MDLLSKILHGEYKEGARLPSEAEFATIYSVSRATVREALKSLQRAGVVRTVHGSGGASFVKRPDSTIVTEGLMILLLLEDVTVADLMEARMILAPAIAGLAAERATDQELLELQAIWDTGEADHGHTIEAVYFKLGSMAHNPALDTLSQPLIRLVFMIFRPPVSSGYSELISHHKNVVDAVVKRDADEARFAMRHVMELAYGGLGGYIEDFRESIRNVTSDILLQD
jgi:DNA-binding FadR family transcriptional regulator